MSEHPLLYRVAVKDFVFHVREIKGVEELSAPFRMHAWFPLDHQTMVGIPEDFDPNDIVKQEATVILERGGVPVRRIQGVVTEVELSASVSGVPDINLVIEPRFALLRHRHDVRIHRNLTAPEIVTQVVGAIGVKVDNRLSGSYPSRPYCVQWRETDFDYCNRLLEDEGIYYWFTADDVMVLGDSPDGYEAGPALRFRSLAGANINEDAVHAIGSIARMTPGKVTLRDWNTEHPSLDMDVVHETAMPFSTEWYDYPGEYEEPNEGKRKAKLHAEAFDRQNACYKGASTSGLLYPGVTFGVVDTPVGAEDGAYVVRKIVHDWTDQRTGFEVRFEADREDVTYRPARKTFVPRIFNPMTGFVVMEYPGQDIHCDHFGRVKIHFPWDRIQPKDANCSHWIPTVQDNTGGSSAIPREGWEMMVHFLEGDPDRPIILGRVYNGTDQFNEKLPYAKDRSGLKSFTSPSRPDGANEIRLEDAKGFERIFVHATKDKLVNIANDLNQSVGNTCTTTVKHNESETIGGDSKWSIGDDLEPMIGHDQKWSVTADRKVKVGKSNTCHVGNDHTLKITGNHERTIFSDCTLGAKTMTETMSKGLTEKFKKVHTIEVAKLCELESGSWTETMKVNKAESTTVERKDTIKGFHIVMCDEEYQCRIDQLRQTTIEGSLLAYVGKVTNFTGAKELRIHTKNSTTLMGSQSIVMKVGNTEIVMRDGLIRLTSDATVKFTVAGPANHNSTISKQVSLVEGC